jgi:hypothetical protein
MGTMEAVKRPNPHERKKGLAVVALAVALACLGAAGYLTWRAIGKAHARALAIVEEKESAERMRPLYEAGKEMSAATTVGVNKIRFRELLSTLSARVDSLRDRATSEREREVAESYRRVVEMYEDSAAIWDLEKASTEITNPFYGLSPILPKLMKRVCLAAERNGLPVHFVYYEGSAPQNRVVAATVGMNWEQGGTVALDPDDATLIWTAAAARLHDAEALLLGRRTAEAHL